MTPTNVYVCSKSKWITSTVARGKGSKQCSLQYGIRQGKKKLRKGKFLVGVDFQWNESARRENDYKKIMIKV